MGDTFERIAAMGFANVEAHGPQGRAQSVRDALDACSLRSPSAIAPFLSPASGVRWTPEVASALDRLLDDTQTLGAHTLIDAWTDRYRWSSTDEIQRTADLMNSSVDAAASRGISLGHHNHTQEFVNRHDGRSALEYFFDLLDPLAIIEVDMFWAATGGEDVVGLLERLGDRVLLIHTKDGPLGLDPSDVVNREDERPAHHLPAGQGDMPMSQILAAAKHAEYAIVEFDDCAGDVFAAIAESATSLRAEGVR